MASGSRNKEGRSRASPHKSDRAQSTHNNPPTPESSYNSLRLRIPAQTWGFPQPESYTTPLRAFEHPYQDHPTAPNLFANTVLPYNHEIYPHPTLYHDSSATHNPYYNFQSHPAQPNRRPQEQLRGHTQATQAPPLTKPRVIWPSEPVPL